MNSCTLSEVKGQLCLLGEEDSKDLKHFRAELCFDQDDVVIDARISAFVLSCIACGNSAMYGDDMLQEYFGCCTDAGALTPAPSITVI